jgi:hypothetical protein
MTEPTSDSEFSDPHHKIHVLKANEDRQNSCSTQSIVQQSSKPPSKTVVIIPMSCSNDNDPPQDRRKGPKDSSFYFILPRFAKEVKKLAENSRSQKIKSEFPQTSHSTEVKGKLL